jgi:uncharacterized protein (TIGR02646 family)
MIRINRPDVAPEILRTKGKRKTAALKANYTKRGVAYRSGDKKFVFDREVYADVTVKQALIAAQSGKCCFCESKVTHVSYGDVEHFRPKSAFRQSRSAALTNPGYYWLAYEWENLLFGCELCNRRSKANLFPLADQTLRAACHSDDIDSEEPLFIDPARDDPEEYISFRAEVPFAINDNPRGEETIGALNLRDREALSERRRDVYEQLKHDYNLVEIAEGIPG